MLLQRLPYDQLTEEKIPDPGSQVEYLKIFMMNENKQPTKYSPTQKWPWKAVEKEFSQWV